VDTQTHVCTGMGIADAFVMRLILNRLAPCPEIDLGVTCFPPQFTTAKKTERQMKNESISKSYSSTDARNAGGAGHGGGEDEQGGDGGGVEGKESFDSNLGANTQAEKF